MENNTFTTTVFAQTPAPRAFEYLRRLQNLDEWTLGSRMVTRIDDDTAMGTASGYQTMLCYHVRTLEHPRFAAIEWQCGYRYREYFKQYPVFVFPSQYANPRGDEDGSYIHWISVIDPARRTEMIMQGIAAVHHYEGRGLKAALERREGLTQPAKGRVAVLSDTMWVDAPIEMARELLADRQALAGWAPLFRAVDPAAGSFADEYARRVEVEFAACELGDYVLVEQDYTYPDLGAVQRCPIVLVPSARAFGPEAPGFLLHRIAFVASDGSQAFGRTTAAELTAESMAIKRLLEARAGNVTSFARGMSYRQDPTATGVARNFSSAIEAAPPDIFAPDFAADPYPHYRRMRDEYPLYFHAPTRAWILSRYDDVRLALTNPSFTTRSYAAQTEPLLGRTLIQLDGREHALQRGLLTPSFSAMSIRDRFTDLIGGTVDELIAAVSSHGKADLVTDVVVHLPVRIMAGLLGLPAQDRDRFRGWYTALIQGALNLTGDPVVAAAATTARDELDAYLRPLIAARREQPGTDLISTLATTAVDGDRLTDEQIVRFAMLMVFAGGETTEKGLSTTLRNLLAHPDVLSAVRRDRSLLPRAIAESFRLTAPTHMVPRQTREEIQVSGGLLPAGAEVMCFLGSANRDERRFADPDRFDLHRPESDPERAFTGQAAHLAFGGGRHFCLGACTLALRDRGRGQSDPRRPAGPAARRRHCASGSGPVSARPGHASRALLAALGLGPRGAESYCFPTGAVLLIWVTHMSKAEVWQGTLALMVLKTLNAMGPQHGYGIARRIEQTSENLLSINHGTLYPVLLKLEQEGAIASQWGVSENNRRAKFYRITKTGEKQLASEMTQWAQAAGIVGRFIALKGGKA